MTGRPAAVAAGRRVFFKEDQGNTLAGWEFDGSRGRELWSRFIRITENKGQAYLGYHEGNVIVPGRGNIYFVNADNGWVNYRFSAVVPAGEAIIPENDWFREAGILGLNPQDVMSYAIFNGYLIGCVRDRKKPIYVWKLPDPLVPRGT
jgi:hypothetical protein